MFIYTGDQIINSNRITMVGINEDTIRYADEGPRTYRNVYIEIANGLMFNEWDGRSAPDYRQIVITDTESSAKWHSLYAMLVKAIYSAIDRNENFDVDEWIDDAITKLQHKSIGERYNEVHDNASTDSSH